MQNCFVYRWEKHESVVMLNYEIKNIPTLINHSTVSNITLVFIVLATIW